jgi:tyrosyl-tRNA synthetase
LTASPSFIEFAVETSFAPSKGSARRDIINGAFSKNKVKISDVNSTMSVNDLIYDKYIILQKGKKYSLAVAE